MSIPLLKVINLKKYFPVYAGFMRQVVDHVRAVDSVNFSIDKGEVFGLVGESGSGKSTTARVAIRLLEPTAGEVYFQGNNFLSFSQKELLNARRMIQIVFQDPYSSLNPRKTVRQAIGEALFYHHIVSSESEMCDYIVDILEKVGLASDALDRYPHQFSGGQQQRICIGRAIALRPRLLVCDEAVSALDVSVQAQILNLLMELQDSFDLSYLFISHDLSVVKHICNHIAVMYQGQIIEQGVTDQIFSDPQEEYTKKLLRAIPISHPRKRKNMV